MNDPSPAISPSIASAVVANHVAQRRETKPSAKKHSRLGDSIHDTLETSDHGGHSPSWTESTVEESTSDPNTNPLPSPDATNVDGSILDISG